ncbi:MAG: glycosyltransferase [Endomicrobia bacterium]|nr:glycosyltransferase [Endomicrobiia bacterium]
MRIAYIITGMGLGGAEIVTVDIANRAAWLGNDVLIIYLTGENIHKERLEGIKTIGLRMSKTPWGFLKGFFKALSIVRNFRPDVVHGQMFHANIFARILRIFCRFGKLICTEHSNNIESGLRMKIYRLTDFLSDFNSNVSKTAVNHFIEKKAFGFTKSRAVYDGIDLSKFTPDPSARKRVRKENGISADEFLFLNVGRLVKAKDQHNLIAAFSEMFNLYGKKVRLMIAGEGQLLDELKNFAAEKKLGDSVLFLGGQSKVQDYYNACDCFVLSSAWEGFGMVIVEAMACGAPVIATDAGGCGEIIGNTDFIVPVRDSKALFEKMKYVYELAEQDRKEIGDVNTKNAVNYDINSIVRQWIEIYKS